MAQAPSPAAAIVAYSCLAGSVAAALFSVAASQMLLAAAAAMFLLARPRLVGESWWPPATLWAFSGLFLWTLLAALFSDQPFPDVKSLKKFFLFLVFFMTPPLMKAAGARLRTYGFVFAAGTLAGALGVFQYWSVPGRDINHRITGFMSHWMTFAGLLMLVFVALVAHALSVGMRRSWWAIPAGALIASGMVLSETRNTLLGALAALALMLVLARRYRALAAAAAIVLLLYSTSPPRMRNRIVAGFDLDHDHTRPRVELFRTALRLIADRPMFGVGPGSVASDAPSYRVSTEYPDGAYVHMHNNFLQIAAERGIPGLLLWIWFIARLASDSIKRFRMAQALPPEDRMASLAALGATAALLTAGLFEYNFGDSEVLTLFLFMVAAPYATRARAD
jgi:O-antigen ligase